MREHLQGSELKQQDFLFPPVTERINYFTPNEFYMKHKLGRTLAKGEALGQDVFEARGEIIMQEIGGFVVVPMPVVVKRFKEERSVPVTDAVASSRFWNCAIDATNDYSGITSVAVPRIPGRPFREVFQEAVEANDETRKKYLYKTAFKSLIDIVYYAHKFGIVIDDIQLDQLGIPEPYEQPLYSFYNYDFGGSYILPSAEAMREGDLLMASLREIESNLTPCIQLNPKNLREIWHNWEDWKNSLEYFSYPSTYNLHLDKKIESRLLNLIQSGAIKENMSQAWELGHILLKFAKDAKILDEDNLRILENQHRNLFKHNTSDANKKNMLSFMKTLSDKISPFLTHLLEGRKFILTNENIDEIIDRFYVSFGFANESQAKDISGTIPAYCHSLRNNKYIDTAQRLRRNLNNWIDREIPIKKPSEILREFRNEEIKNFFQRIIKDWNTLFELIESVDFTEGKLDFTKITNSSVFQQLKEECNKEQIDPQKAIELDEKLYLLVQNMI